MNKLANGVVELTNDEALSVCKVGKGSECCAYIVMGKSKKFECLRMVADKAVGLDGRSLAQQIVDGTMSAKGLGGWEGCIWEGEINLPTEKA